MKTRNSLLTLALGATLLSGIANAQAPGTPGAPGDAAAPAGAGAVTNSTTTETTVTTDPGADVAVGEPMAAGEALPDTGGEPWLMAFAGIAIAGGALVMRRKLA
ncbi:MAG TPA: LPXTG cell wall anchor domain-containing protein [Abditibacteriaceae bacterium]|jgi:LPXTG-motif cell wall-anchored protein